jgi:ParB family chromosome partitioning protein
MNKRTGLGKGLAELIPVAAPPQNGERVVSIAIEEIEPNPYQPRREFDADALAELAASIRAQGLLQPITVRSAGDGGFQLIAGERRLRATRDIGQTVIRAIVREVTDKQLLELSLVENLIRSDLNDIEVARSLHRLQNQYGYSTTQLAEVIGKSRPAVSNTLRLLELPDAIQEMVRAGTLAAGHARTILSFPSEMQGKVAEQCAGEGWSVRELERRANQANDRRPMRRPRKKNGMAPGTATQLRRYEKDLMEHLGTRVKLSEQGGEGAITITYYGAEDLSRILGLLLRDKSPI